MSSYEDSLMINNNLHDGKFPGDDSDKKVIDNLEEALDLVEILRKKVRRQAEKILMGEKLRREQVIKMIMMIKMMMMISMFRKYNWKK